MTSAGLYAAPPLCVQHKDGWCVALDQMVTTYRDSVTTLCGCEVVLPWAIAHHEPDCAECQKVLSQVT